MHLHLTYQPPFDWTSMLAFLDARATPGVEIVRDGVYRRTVAPGSAIVEAVDASDRGAMRVALHPPDPDAREAAVPRLRRMFDLDADPLLNARSFERDELLGPLLRRHPGIRVPGAWDGFELSVRAIVGQQTSVRAAATIAGRIAAAWGTPVDGASGLDRLFPTPPQLADAPLERTGVMPSRAETIRRLAKAVCQGDVALEAPADQDIVRGALMALPGIGPWTVEYIAMRALRDPDAFPAGDLVLRRAAGGLSEAALRRHSERWRPRRAYAAMLLWRGAA